ncbi:hypothetical protein NUACC21_39280 [Scytonema sp. NUACC21]
MLINEARANFSIPNNLIEFLIEEFVSPLLRDLPMGFGEEEGNEWLEILFNRHFPRFIVIRTNVGFWFRHAVTVNTVLNVTKTFYHKTSPLWVHALIRT